MATIGQRIRDARLRQGWSQAAVARELGCDRGTVKNIEHTVDEPPKGSVYFDRFLGLLGLDLDAPDVGDGADPDDPPLSRATKLQTVAHLHRLIAEDAPDTSTTGPAAAIEVMLPRNATKHADGSGG